MAEARANSLSLFPGSAVMFQETARDTILAELPGTLHVDLKDLAESVVVGGKLFL
jgi:hypothetical protein